MHEARSQARIVRPVRLAEGQLVAERNADLHDARIPWRILQARPGVTVVIADELAMVVGDARIQMNTVDPGLASP